MNFATRILAEQRPSAVALVERSRDGRGRVWSFPGGKDRRRGRRGRTARARVERGDVVMTLVGNRQEWVFGMLASFRQG
jgi:acyl-coenzyme A synthetase/AMP-(fatty) acid ligase